MASLVDKVNPFKEGPSALVAHRCDQHRGMAPLNTDGQQLAVYPTEGRIKLFPLGSGPNGERINAECGGCIAEEVEGLYQTVLDLMDVIADQLTAHATQKAELEKRDAQDQFRI